MNSKERTQTFSIRTSKETETKKILETVYQALIEKGYDPLDQLVGYILSEDPTYITNYNNARSLIRRIDRDELMRILIRSYLNIR
ncbi:MAG: IreB family regulatory phosphoprotein [Clostridia bacterium]|nr:IreB family regulatory phosphoprotein [Clostridia bacterium]